MGNKTTKTSPSKNVITVGDYRYTEEAGQRLVQRNGLIDGGVSSGVMWRGWRISDRQPVSVKKLIASDLANQEIDCMLTLDHPNILKLLSFYVKSPYVYVISEFCTCDLDEFLSAVKGQIDWRDQLPVLARNLAHGYNCIYEKRILHRNINPHTVVVVHRGTEISFKLSGFEHSKHTNVDGVANTVIAVNLDPYKAPELGAAIVAERSLSYDHRVDIWSLGTILYRCAVGRTPWTSSMVAKLFFTLATSAPRPGSGVPGVGANLSEFQLPLPLDVPSELTCLLRRMLEITFTKRMTAEEFLHDDYVSPDEVNHDSTTSRRGDRTGGNEDSDSQRDSFCLQTKQIECIGRHTLKRRKQLKEERRLRDLPFASSPDIFDNQASDSRHQQQLNIDDHYCTLRHEDEDDNEATIRQTPVRQPPPLPPRKKSAASTNGNASGMEETSSDNGSVGSQTLLAEGMQILSEHPTFRSVEDGDTSLGTIRYIDDGTQYEDAVQDLPETNLDIGQAFRVVTIGPYEYQEEPSSFLGRGSFGSVWTGHNRTTGEPAAIKALTYLAGADREIKILRSVNHPNVLRFLYAHKIANTLYMVTELCRCDLKTFLDASPNRRLQNCDVQKVARDLASGYYALYSARILHRDIKPKNILLAQCSMESRPREYVLKLADFGCGRFRESNQYESSPMTKGAMGTIEYMAPEVGARQMIPDSKYDARADVWSIGVVLHECACGALPVSRIDLWRLSMSVASNGKLADCKLDTSNLLTGVSEDCPQEFKQLLLEMLQPMFQMRLKPDEFYRHPYVTRVPVGGLKLATSRPRTSLTPVQ